MIFVCIGLSKGIANVSIFGLLILSIFTFDKKYFIENCSKYKNVVVLVIVFIVFILGLMHTSDLSQGLKVVRTNHKYLLMPVIFLLNVELVKKHFKALIFTFFISVSLAGVFTILLYFLPEDMVIWISNLTPFMQDYIHHYDRVSFGFYSPFYDRLQFSNMLGIATLSGLYLMLDNYRRKLCFVGILILIYCSILLGGRGGQLALLFSLFIFSVAYLYKNYLKNKKQLYALLLGIFIIFTATPTLLYKYNHSVHKRYGQMKWELKMFFSDNYKKDITHFTTARRLVSWQNTWNVAKGNILFGIGTGDFENAINNQYENDDYYLPVNNHSQYLYFLAMLGIIGLGIFISVLMYWLQSFDKNSTIFLYGLSFLSFYFIAFMFEVPLSKQIDNMTFTTLFCVLGIYGNKKAIIDKN